MHELWPALRKLVGQLYETGRVTDSDRLVFRTDSGRAAILARRLLPASDAEFPHGYEVLTSILAATSLDEILGLSLEHFRHLQESLDEAQQLIERRLPLPKPAPRPAPATAAAPEPPAPAVERAVRRHQGFPVGSAVAAGLILALAVALLTPAVRDPLLARTGLGRLLGRDEAAPPAGQETHPAPKSSTPAASPPTAAVPPAPPRPEPKVSLFRPLDIPKAAPSPAPKASPPAVKPPEPSPAVEPPKPKGEPPPPAPKMEPVATPTPEPAAKAEPAKRFPSRWKPGPNGWIVLFDGRSLDGWIGVDDHWQVRDSELRGVGSNGVAFLNAREADWTDYTLSLKLLLGKSGDAVISHGVLAAHLGERQVRLGYPQQGWRTLDQKDKGLARLKWYDVAFTVRGKHAEVRINDQVALATDAHEPLAGAPALEALEGGVAFRDIRVRLIESDPDYRAVALGEGYADDPSKRAVATEPGGKAEDPPRTAALPPGDHVLFSGRDLDGWAKSSGSWSLRDGLLVAQAELGQLAVAVVPATSENRDYVLKVRCRLLRTSEQSREGEYILLVFRHWNGEGFHCLRFPIEGIFEFGCYRGGRFREEARGVRKGRFNEWHEIELTVRGMGVDLRVDGLGGFPTFPAKTFSRGAVGIGVTGGEAAFRDVRVRILR